MRIETGDDSRDDIEGGTRDDIGDESGGQTVCPNAEAAIRGARIKIVSIYWTFSVGHMV